MCCCCCWWWWFSFGMSALWFVQHVKIITTECTRVSLAIRMESVSFISYICRIYNIYDSTAILICHPPASQPLWIKFICFQRYPILSYSRTSISISIELVVQDCVSIQLKRDKRRDTILHGVHRLPANTFYPFLTCLLVLFFVVLLCYSVK